ncbi:hypothetical protein V493_00828 [Pseudogymnoascus sp. VKM F-4281 (FW-2241)]|nr:hypothetical protein V493_00828 [Pseudogymnoascus sp. VKM F-4281 (FW-2241)]
MPPLIHLEGLQTEGRNQDSNHIDRVSTLKLCQIINSEDSSVATAVQKCLPIIAQAIDALEVKARKGGRIVYVGAGTSGRLGVLDASEIPPTFSAPSEQFVALIAGGDVALRHAQEGAEDDVEAAREDLKALDLNPDLDSLIGIAASGRTPYVLSCLAFAKSLGCITIGIACCDPSAMSSSGNVDHMISVVTGPEVVTGSTRMKAGTATKLVLNMLSTGVMIRVGKTYGNMMIDLKSSNHKLQQRSRNIIRTICGASAPVSDEELDRILALCNGSVKLTVATILLQVSEDEAAQRLQDAKGVLADVLDVKPVPEDDHFVLCVDGGGSKCAAVILGQNGEEGRGEAGECNVSSSGIESVIASISLAIQRAVDACEATKGKLFTSIPFKSIWIGVAGYDRPIIAELVNSALADLFNRPVGDGLRISNDIELLVAPLTEKSHLHSVTILVAGTGSAVMSFKRVGNQFIPSGRRGGWGSSLGDDGSGYSIGRGGLRVALEAADEANMRQKSNKTIKRIDPLVAKIFEHFGLDENPNHQVDLLSRILLNDSGQQNSTLKKRIADVSRVVFDAVPLSDTAGAIVENGSKYLARILKLMIDAREADASSSALILTGGLMQSETYQNMVLHGLPLSSGHFGSIGAVKYPALNAAQYMLRQK